MSFRTFFLMSLVVLALPASVGAQAPFVPKTGLVTENGSSSLLKEVKFDQHLGVQLSLDTEFRDESGKTVKLREYFGKRPIVFALVYHECPMLCNVVLNNMVSSLRSLEFTPGVEYDVLTISIAPHETSALASAKRRGFVTKFQRMETLNHWHFLTGDEPNIRKIADEVGFNYAYDPKSGQYAHASGIMILTPEGKVSRYFYGVDYPTRDLRFGIMEASEEKIGSPIAQVLLMCFHYDPTTGKYSLAVMRILQACGLVTVIGLGMSIVTMLRRDRRQRRLEALHGLS
jgi:protein SCO1/2